MSWLCLMLADFPNSNGWQLRLGDVFLSSGFRSSLENARIVVCNPPYERFSHAEKDRYAPLRSDLKPIELLERVLDSLHPEGMLGFVLPNTLLRGEKYSNLRRRLAEGFGHIEIVELPESNVFFISEHRSVLLIAHEPSPRTGVVSITYKALEKTDREPSLVGFAVTREDHGEKTHEEAAASLAIPPLAWMPMQKKKPNRIAVLCPFSRYNRHSGQGFPVYLYTDVHSLEISSSFAYHLDSPFSRSFRPIGSLALTGPRRSDIWGLCLPVNPRN